MDYIHFTAKSSYYLSAKFCLRILVLRLAIRTPSVHSAKEKEEKYWFGQKSYI